MSLLAAILLDAVFVPLCIPRTLPPVDDIEVCTEGPAPAFACYHEPAHEGRTSAFVHGDPLATLYIRAFAAGQPIDEQAPWEHPECNGFENFKRGVLITGKSLRLGHYYGPKERSWASSRTNQRRIAYPEDVNDDGRVTPADLAIIDGWFQGTIPDDTETLCIDYDCTPFGFYGGIDYAPEEILP